MALDASHALAVREKVQSFLNAALTGNLDLLKQLAQQLDDGKGLAQTVVDIKDANKRGALHFAAREGQTEVCKYLLEDLNIDVNIKDEDGETPLTHAARHGHTSTAKYLVERGADPSIPSELGTTALHHSAGIGDIELLKFLLTKGVNVDLESDAGTPLVWAAGHAQQESVNVLLEHNANPNAKTEDDVTPLLSAVAAGSLACLELLIKAGASVNVTAGGATPLHIAADSGSTEVLNCLLQAGANPNATDEEGLKPIQVAAARGNKAAVEILYPVTLQIADVPEWSIDGILEHMQHEAQRIEVKDRHTGATRIRGRLKNDTYCWPHGKSPPTALTTSRCSASLWHSRFGHPSVKVLHHLVSSNKLQSSTLSDVACVSCKLHKSHKLPFHESSLMSKAPLELVFSDVWTSPIQSYEGLKYYVIFVDHFSKYIWLFPLKRKSDVLPTFIKFKGLVEKYFSTPIISLFTDNGGEFIALRPFLTSHGISHLTSPPHTPEHNGFAERRHRHIVETALTLLHHASVPSIHWPYAFATAVYLINRLPKPNLSMQSSYSILFHRAPNLSRLRVFGCQCFPWLRPYTSHKLEPRSRACVFFGYSTTQSAYLCFDPSTSRVFASRHVEFHENVFPFSLSVRSPAESPPPTLEPVPGCQCIKINCKSHGKNLYSKYG